MNERIKQLAEQASLELFNDTAQHRLLKGFAEKFAELIVKECISALDEKIYRSIDGDGDEIWADLILKEHFGVEE
jgi:hypothetical protein